MSETLAPPAITVTGDKHDLEDVVAGDLLRAAQEHLADVKKDARAEPGLHSRQFGGSTGVWEVYAYRYGPLSISYGLNSPKGECVWRQQEHR